MVRFEIQNGQLNFVYRQSRFVDPSFEGAIVQYNVEFDTFVVRLHAPFKGREVVVKVDAHGSITSITKKGDPAVLESLEQHERETAEAAIRQFMLEAFARMARVLGKAAIDLK